MPGLQPIALNVPENEWKAARGKLLRALNYVIKDIYEHLGEIKGIDNKVFEPEDITLPESTVMESLTASRLMSTDASKTVVSTDITSWLADTTNQITITDDGDGSATVSLPAAIYVPDGQVFGLGAAKGRMVYNDEAIDVIAFMDCYVGIGGVPGLFRLDVVGDARFGGPSGGNYYIRRIDSVINNIIVPMSLAFDSW